MEAVDPTRDELLNIADTIKRPKPLPPQVTPSDTVLFLGVKKNLIELPPPRVQEKVNTGNNIVYPTTSPPQFPSATATNRFTAAGTNTVYDRLKQ